MQTKTLYLKACCCTYTLTIYVSIDTYAMKSLQRGMASLGYLPGMISTLRVSRQARAWQARAVSFTGTIEHAQRMHDNIKWQGGHANSYRSGKAI